MPNQLFIYNKNTCDYEPYRPSMRRRFLKAFLFLGLSLICSVIILNLLKEELGTPKEHRILAEREVIQIQLLRMEDDIDFFYSRLITLNGNDEDIYRIILEGEQVPASIRNAGAGGANHPNVSISKSLVFKDKILKNYLYLDRINRQIYIQSLSLDELNTLARERNKFWLSIPSIQPVYNKNLRRLSTIFGMRFHPILKKYRPHKGLDFMANKGTPVYATGNGVVKSVRYSKTFGKVIEIDHGYGFISRYAHLNDYNAQKGDIVKRGQSIGFVGNTGLSLSSHLHYEVLKDKVQINPIGFFQKELDNEAYARLLELAKKETIPLD